MTYNGWVNYPTWAVHLWISNEEALWDDAMAVARDFSGGAIWRGEDALRNWVLDELVPDLSGSMAGDIMTWAMEQVDWGEVYAAVMEAVEEEDDDEAE